jgi:hypothetical protein
MLGAARTAQLAGWRAPSGPANARRTGTASTNASQSWDDFGAVTSTAQYQFGTASQYVADSNDYIYTITDVPSFMNYGTGEFCIEFWIYIPSLSGHGNSCDLLSNDTSGGFGIRLAQSYETNGLSSGDPKYINIFARGQADLDYWTLPSNWPTGSWNFVAIQRKGTTMSCWVNGTLLSRSGSGGGTRDFANATSNIKVGTADGANGVGEAYIDEVCWSNTYRYDDTTADIPVPTAAFTVDSYTTQLMHMDGADDGTTFTNATS